MGGLTLSAEQMREWSEGRGRRRTGGGELCLVYKRNEKFEIKREKYRYIIETNKNLANKCKLYYKENGIVKLIIYLMLCSAGPSFHLGTLSL